MSKHLVHFAGYIGDMVQWRGLTTKRNALSFSNYPQSNQRNLRKTREGRAYIRVWSFAKTASCHKKSTRFVGEIRKVVFNRIRVAGKWKWTFYFSVVCSLCRALGVFGGSWLMKNDIGLYHGDASTVISEFVMFGWKLPNVLMKMITKIRHHLPVGVSLSAISPSKSIMCEYACDS